MVRSASLFSQLLKQIPRNEFAGLVKEHFIYVGGDLHVDGYVARRGQIVGVSLLPFQFGAGRPSGRLHSNQRKAHKARPLEGQPS